MDRRRFLQSAVTAALAAARGGKARPRAPGAVIASPASCVSALWVYARPSAPTNPCPLRLPPGGPCTACRRCRAPRLPPAAPPLRLPRPRSHSRTGTAASTTLAVVVVPFRPNHLGAVLVVHGVRRGRCRRPSGPWAPASAAAPATCSGAAAASARPEMRAGGGARTARFLAKTRSAAASTTRVAVTAPGPRTARSGSVT